MPGSPARPSASRRALAWILRQPLDHAGRPVAQRHQPGRCQHPHLAHAAAHQLAGSPSAPDEVPAADHHRADRAGQALGEAEGGAVGIGEQFVGRRAEGHDRVEEARPVHVQRDAVLMRHRGDGARVGRGQRLAHAHRVRVLEHDQRRDGLVGVSGVTDRGSDIVEVHGAVRPGRHRPGGGAADDGVPAGLVEDEVGFGGRDRSPHRAARGPCGPRGCPWCRWPRRGRPACRSARQHAPAGH